MPFINSQLYRIVVAAENCRLPDLKYRAVPTLAESNRPGCFGCCCGIDRAQGERHHRVGARPGQRKPRRRLVANEMTDEIPSIRRGYCWDSLNSGGGFQSGTSRLPLFPRYPKSSHLFHRQRPPCRKMTPTTSYLDKTFKDKRARHRIGNRIPGKEKKMEGLSLANN